MDGDLARQLPSIDQVARATHNERARQRFVSSLRKRVMVDMPQHLRAAYENVVLRDFKRQKKRAPRDGREIRQAMLSNPYFRAWSTLRYVAQEMTWWSVQPQVERNVQQVNAVARAVAAQPGLGSLQLDSTLAIPRDVSVMDIHLMPGCFHTEYVPQDAAPGAIYFHGTHVFSAGLKLRVKGGGVGRSIAEWLRIRFPQLQPQRILDVGTTEGGNLMPYLDVYRDAEGHGIDVGAPMLRFGHALARARGYNIHFAQMDARRMTYPDNHFDLVVSSFFLHEQSAASNRAILREVYRVLRPGGFMVHMELPPAEECDPYYNFYLDWDAYYNNEPHYAGFRTSSPLAECARAGFKPERSFKTRIPNYTTVSDAEFAAVARGEKPAPAHGNGASWFIFGGAK
ncbi:MAG: class I SAM-dependent methyltransferase [Pseudomonadales bacterium]|nr:class I SAM-dependent methyltransferase [Pseudomonadales bacterium]